MIGRSYVLRVQGTERTGDDMTGDFEKITKKMKHAEVRSGEQEGLIPLAYQIWTCLQREEFLTFLMVRISNDNSEGRRVPIRR